MDNTYQIATSDDAWLAALHQLSTEDKQYLAQAQRFAPNIVAAESNPLKYLVCCGYNYIEASRKLTYYWKTRCSLFGSKAFLPLQCGGALGQEEMDYLKLQPISILPTDNYGRPVLLIDPERVPDEDQNSYSLVTRLRCAFTMFSLISTHENSQTIGIVHLMMFGRRKVQYTYSKKIADAIVDWIKHAFALKVSNGYSLAIEENEATRFALATMLDMFVLEYCFDYMATSQAYVASSKDDLARYLLESGVFSLHNLPRYLGGEWDNDTVKTSEINGDNDHCGYAISHTGEARDVGYDASKTATISRLSTKVCFLNQFPEICQSIILLPKAETKALMSVKASAPRLIKDESNPLLYIKFCNGHADSAAKLLASYWKLRFEVYGDKAALPLLSPTKGALTSADVNYLEHGYIKILPKDETTRPVIYCEPLEMDTDNKDKHAKCLFYALQRSLKSLLSNSSIAVIMNNFTLQQIPMLSMIAHYVDTAFPYNAEFYLLCVLDVINFKQVAFKSLNRRVKIILASEAQDFCTALVLNNFSARYLPQSIGGLWKDDKGKKASPLSLQCREDACDRSYLEKEKLRLKSQITRDKRRQQHASLHSELLVLKEKNKTLRSHEALLRSHLDAALKVIENYEKSLLSGNNDVMMAFTDTTMSVDDYKTESITAFNTDIGPESVRHKSACNEPYNTYDKDDVMIPEASNETTIASCKARTCDNENKEAITSHTARNQVDLSFAPPNLDNTHFRIVDEEVLVNMTDSDRALFIDICKSLQRKNW